MRIFIAVGMAALFALATAIVALTVARTIDSTPPIVFTGSFGSDAEAREQKVFRAGETFYARRDFQQIRSIEGIVSARVINTETGVVVLQFAPVVEHFAVGKYEKKFPVLLPVSMSPCVCVYRVGIEYKPGWPWRDAIVDLPPIYFRVVP